MFQFTATIAPEAISKVSRLYNSSITDVINSFKMPAAPARVR